MLARCGKANLVLNWETCIFMLKEGIVLRHKISRDGLEVDRAKIETIVKLPPPTSVKSIWSFLGHAGFYRRFIKDFSNIAHPMTQLFEKNFSFVFRDECCHAFNLLKEKFINAPIEPVLEVLMISKCRYMECHYSCKAHVDLTCRSLQGLVGKFAKDEFKHFSHRHSLCLVYLQQQNPKNENDSDEDEGKDEEEFVEENLHGGECHMCCALLLYRVIKHKCDKHPLSLRYEPVENHISDYFCEICEDELNPWRWFYHCTTCLQSTHTACVPLITQYEQAKDSNWTGVYDFLNVKFGGTLKIEGHPHRLTFVREIHNDGICFECGHILLQGKTIFKCLECKFRLHYKCASSLTVD
ncbi:hypothetical protein E3N88_41066 [Mikania micrantha]|uniref:Phorbol-ester/DAG-type domain-containing protein n=1 Tax=Mikania micrantha TaxID=192012 RepID=A0A5N6LPI1_9ASTR|nr:hypothetical protein E3N88_41066 [Mikania micrantha]